ncbi:MAG TPA: hypothetical protein VFH80_23850 [Solirubrobacteraceae bacterium]|nr:hypothetical protein [Solirubrobacteraceae bacterium]
MCKSIKRLVMIATVLAAAIIPAVASARPVGSDIEPFSVDPPAVHQVVATPTQGFSWHDAAFGAAGMLVLTAVGGGTMLAVRRHAVFG